MTPQRPAFLIGADRPTLGRSLLCLMLADWFSSRLNQPCALVDGEPLRGHLARLSGRASVALAADGEPPENSVVDNADALAPAAATGEENRGDTRNLAALGRWLARRAERGGPRAAIVCVLLDDKCVSDREAADALRKALPADACLGLVAVRNAGLPPRFPLAEDQAYANNGGWPTSAARAAWLNGGGRELVFSRPPGALVSQSKGLRTEGFTPTLLSHPGLWTTSRQQLRHWRRDFAARAEDAFRLLLPFLP